MKKIILIIILVLSTLFINSCCIYNENPGWAYITFSIFNKTGEDIFINEYDFDSVRIFKTDTTEEEYFSTYKNNIIINIIVYNQTIGAQFNDKYLIYLGNNDYDTLQLIYKITEARCNSKSLDLIKIYYNNILYTSSETYPTFRYNFTKY